MIDKLLNEYENVINYNNGNELPLFKEIKDINNYASDCIIIDEHSQFEYVDINGGAYNYSTINHMIKFKDSFYKQVIEVKYSGLLIVPYTIKESNSNTYMLVAEKILVVYENLVCKEFVLSHNVSSLGSKPRFINNNTHKVERNEVIESGLFRKLMNRILNKS